MRGARGRASITKLDNLELQAQRLVGEERNKGKKNPRSRYGRTKTASSGYVSKRRRESHQGTSERARVGLGGGTQEPYNATRLQGAVHVEKMRRSSNNSRGGDGTELRTNTAIFHGPSLRTLEIPSGGEGVLKKGRKGKR